MRSGRGGRPAQLESQRLATCGEESDGESGTVQARSARQKSMSLLRAGGQASSREKELQRLIVVDVESRVCPRLTGLLLAPEPQREGPGLGRLETVDDLPSSGRAEPRAVRPDRPATRSETCIRLGGRDEREGSRRTQAPSGRSCSSSSRRTTTA